MNRLSADASLLLKNSGYGAGFFQPQSNGAHPMPPLSHNNSQPALMMASVKSPARDLGGGSTPALKSSPAAHTSALPSGNNSAAQVITSLSFKVSQVRTRYGLIVSRRALSTRDVGGWEKNHFLSPAL